MHDPDAPFVDGFTHWVAYGSPVMRPTCPEGGGDALASLNSSGERGYRGPAPPPGHRPHHDYFWVYAPDEDLDLEPGPGPARAAGAHRGARHRAGQAIGIYVNEG